MLHPGDIILTTNQHFLGRAIRVAQRLIDSSDPVPYSHAAIVIDSHGGIFESVARIGYGHINKYTGCPVMVMRHKDMTSEKFKRGMASIKRHEGKIYPWWRLGLFLMGLADNIHMADIPVCSELAAEFLIGCPVETRFARHGTAGITPDIIEDAARLKGGPWLISYEGVWGGNDYSVVGATAAVCSSV